MYISRKYFLPLMIIFLSAGLYAKSDLQLGVGLRVAEVSYNDARIEAMHIPGQDEEVNDTLYGMCVSLTNYNAWGLGKRGVVAVGFMDSVSASFSEHNATGCTAMIGPAMTATMGDILTFQCAAGFSLGVLRVESDIYTDGTSDTSVAIGFALDARVCFMPAARAGPLVGARYEYNKINDMFTFDIDRGAFTFYAGVAVHFPLR